MANNTGIISSQDLTSMFTDVSNAMANMQFDYTTVADKISFWNTGSKAKFYKLPFSPVSNAPKLWPEGKDRDFAPAQVFYVEGEHNRIGPANELIFNSELQYDTYNILAGKMADVIARSKKVYDINLAVKIGTAQTDLCYDGTAFFNTAHPVNPVNAALGTYSNLLANTTLDETGLNTALDALRQIKGWDGELLNAYDGELVILVPNERLRTAALKLMNGEFYPTVYGANTAAASVSNVLKGRANVLLYPELSDKGPTPSKAWYVMKLSNQRQRPFVVSIAQPPVFNYSGLGDSDFIRVLKGGVTYGWEMEAGFGFGLPQLVVKCLEP